MKSLMLRQSLLMLTVWAFAACSSVPQSGVFSQQVTASAFVAELNSSTLQTVTITHSADSQIAWAKLTEAQDFKYFQIEKVSANGDVIVQDGVEDYVANSRAQIPALSVATSTGGENEFTDGGLNLSTEDGLQFTIRFAPQAAPESEDEPFEATLEIYYTAPEEGVYLVNLQGYVQGIKSDKCSQNISTYDVLPYQFKDSQFGFYMCSPEVAATDNANAPERGASTNFAQMPIDGEFYFYQPDAETVCLMHATNTAGPENPSIPDFDFIIPEGLAEVDSLPLSLFSTAECSVDATSGAIFCDENIYLDTLISISAMTATTGSVAAADLVTSQCPDFGDIAGSGGLGQDSMSLILYGTVLPDSITEGYNIADAMILGVIDLVK